jgi:hypothetical protein
MQLKIQRSQRQGGTFSNTVYFCLDVRAQYSPEEAANISNYKLSNQIIYISPAAQRHSDKAIRHLDASESGGAAQRAAGIAKGAFSMVMAHMALTISIGSLGRGHHIECKELPELLDAEATVMEACRGLMKYLQIATTFDGSETVIDFSDEEKTHIIEHAPLLLEGPATSTAATPEPIAPSGTTLTRNQWIALVVVMVVLVGLIFAAAIAYSN